MSETILISDLQIRNEERSFNKGTIELTNKTLYTYQQDFKMTSQGNNTY